MPRPRNLSAACCLALIASTSPSLFHGAALAQYPGHTQSPAEKKKTTSLRALSVVEYTGQLGKPTAARVLPVAVYENGEYHDGALYLAKPQPLAIDSGTEYELQQSGLEKGLFDIFGSREVGDSTWFGYGIWKQTPAPKPSKFIGQVVDPDETRPRLKQEEAADKGANRKGGSNGPMEGGPGNAGPMTIPGGGRTRTGSSDSKNQPSTADDDPSRPKLKQRKPATDSPAAAAADVGPADPDRPRMKRGNPAERAGDRSAPLLMGNPPGVQQIVAVSDTTTREAHPFAYAWNSTDESSAMQAVMETIARQALLQAAQAQLANAATKKPATTARSTTAPNSKLRRPAQPRLAANPPLLVLSNIQFSAFSVQYDNVATLVLSAQTDIALATGTLTRYVTLVAQPDIYGKPQILLQQVTDSKHLDLTPRLKLIDAVDSNGDNRAELLFEESVSSSTRKFALYQIARGTAKQIFETGPLAEEAHLDPNAP